MINKNIYYSLKEMYGGVCEQTDVLPYFTKNLKQISDIIFGESAPTYPVDLDSASIVKLWQEIYARFYEEPILKIRWAFYEPIPTFEDASFKEFSTNEFKLWFLRVISIISRTQSYYLSLLDAYADAQDHLMDDIRASSVNTIKYNETPQNIDTTGIYEGDDHLTNFTKTEGENTSPLTSKIMRLKEIQDHYKKVLDDWVNEFHCLFYEGGDC